MMVFISLLAIGAASASDSDNMTDTLELSAVDDEVQPIQVENNQNIYEASEGVELNLNVKNATYDEPVFINGTVVDNMGTFDFKNSTVEISVDYKQVATASVSDDGDTKGYYEYTFDPGVFEAGTHYLKATLISDGNEIVTADTKFIIEKADPIVIVENITATIGAGVKVPVNVTDRNGKKVSGDAIVTIFFDGNSISKYAKIINGSVEATFDMADMMGNMMGMMGGDMWGSGDNSSQNSTMQFNITEMMKMMNGTGQGQGGFGPFASGTSAVKFTYFLPVGTYNVTAIFLPNRNYNEAENTTDLTVVYNTDVLFIVDVTAPKNIGDKTLVYIMALDKYGNIMPNIKVTIVLDDNQEVNMTLDDYAAAQISFDNLVAGNHKLVFITNATGNMTNQTYDFDVVLPRINVTITAEDITVTTVNTALDGKVGKYFTATLKDELGNVLVNKTVLISIDNEKYNVTTNEDGVAQLQLNIAKGNVYTCAIAFLGDDAYNGVFDIAKVTVNKQTAKLTTKSASYKAKAKTKKITATFKSAKGKALKNKKITFKVNGKTYTAKTNSKGVATAKVKITKKGKFTFTAKFAGDDTYKALSKKGKLTIK